MSAAMASEATGDPGWGGALRRAWPALLLPFPHGALLLARNADGLTRLRTFFLSFAFTPITIGIILWLIMRDAEPDPGESALPYVALCLGLGFSELAMITFFTRRRPLVAHDAPSNEKSDPVAVARAYRASAALGASLAQSAFLIGFVATFIADRVEMILLGIPFMAVGLFLSAPTASDLARRQEELRLQGSSVDLVEAVKTSPWGRT
jgi:hypothetical protein